MPTRAQILRLLAITVTISFYTGLIAVFQELQLALSLIAENEYLHYRMSRLAALQLKQPLQDWLLHILIVNLFVIIIFLAWKLFLAGIFKFSFDIRLIDPKKLKTYTALIITAIVLIYSEWTVNINLATVRFSILNIALNIGVLLFTCLTGWLLLKTAWENIFKIFTLKYLGRLTVCLAIALFIFSIIVFAASQEWEKPGGPNIILIVVDCLRADHVSSYGYNRETSPHIDKLAATGLLFKKAYTCAPWTKPAIAALFSSLYPNKHNTIVGAAALPARIPTLAEILRNSGYRTYIFNAGNSTVGEKFNFYQGFDTFFETERWSAIVTDQFLAQMADAVGEKFFAYIHYMDLHLPYNKNEYNNAFTGDIEHYFLIPPYIHWEIIRTATAANAFPEPDKQYLTALYDGQIKYVDSSINKIISYLKKKKMLENTVVIITADHGEEFWDHANFEHGHTMYNELLHIPLIMAGEKFKPAVIETPVSIIDIFPTVLELAGIRAVNIDIDGKSLLNSHNRPLFAVGTLYGDEKYCLVKNDMKFILNSGKSEDKRFLIGYGSKERFELYDLIKDPFEKHNLSLAMPSAIQSLKKELKAFINAGLEIPGQKISLEKEKELKEKLKSLGYM